LLADVTSIITHSASSNDLSDSYIYYVNDSVVSPPLSSANTFELEFDFETIKVITNHGFLNNLVYNPPLVPAVVSAQSLPLAKWHTSVLNCGEMIGYKM
jgi:iron transport multicopper oxidase